MIEPYKEDRRLFFPPGQQKQYLLNVVTQAGGKISKLAQILKLNRRTLNNWINEDSTLPKTIADKIALLFKVDIPDNILIKSKYWFTKEAGFKGGNAVFKKYGRIGDPRICREKWLEWWNKTGKLNPNQYFVAKPISKPVKGNKLAEFVGLMIGDGGITKGQVTVTLNRVTDNEYSQFVAKLFYQLFKVTPSLNNSKDCLAVDITVSRIKLVSYCKGIGLIVGDKLAHGLDIPEWVKNNKKFSHYCLRGLIDTDGCVFSECHRIKGKMYNYPRLVFTSYSKKLCFSVVKILEDLGFSPKIRVGRNVQLENKAEIIKYFKIIGSDNPKHYNRLKEILGRDRIMVIPPVLKTGAL